MGPKPEKGRHAMDDLTLTQTSATVREAADIELPAVLNTAETALSALTYFVKGISG